MAEIKTGGLGRPRAQGKLARGAAWSLVSSVAASVTALVVVSVAYHVVPSRSLGIYLTGLVTAATVALLDPAIALFATREAGGLPDHPDPDDPHVVVLQETQRVCLVMALVLLAAGLAIAGTTAALLHVGSDVSVALMVLGTLPALQVATAVVPAAATGRSAFGVVAAGTVTSAGSALVTSLALVAHLGVLGLALGQLVGLLAGRALVLRWLLRTSPWLRLQLRWPSRAALGRTLGATRGLMLLTATAQVINWADVVIIASLRGPEDVARYRIAVMIPTQLVALAFRGFDVVYPRLARTSPDDHIRTLRLPTRVLSAGLGGALGTLVAMRHDVLSLATGSQELSSATVLVLVTLAWAANVPVHGLVLLLMARGQLDRLLRITLFEAIANIVLTVAATARFGIVGAAAATLAGIAVSNLAVLPWVTSRQVPGVRSIVYAHGLLPLSASLIAVLVLAEGASGVAEGRPGSVLSFAAAAVGSIAAVSLSAGRTGRRTILQSLRRD